jgi:hypothetical protein
MSRILPVSKRIVQKAVLALGNGLFNGHVEAVLLPVDVKALTFNANVKVFTGDTTTPSVEYTPCDDNGNIKKFSNVDDLVNWVKGAYTDILTFKIEIADFDLITNVYKSATDPLKQAVTLKAKYVAAKLALDDNLVIATADVTRATALGWNTATAHAADKANYAEFVAQHDAIVAAQAFYTTQIAKYQAIITP